MKWSLLTVAIEEGVAVATINRPPANALSRGLIVEVDALLNQVAERRDSSRNCIARRRKIFLSGCGY